MLVVLVGLCAGWVRSIAAWCCYSTRRVACWVGDSNSLSRHGEY